MLFRQSLDKKRDDSFVKYKILKRQKPFPIKEKGVCLQSGLLFEADCQLFSVGQQDFGLRPFDFGNFALNRKTFDLYGHVLIMTADHANHTFFARLFQRISNQSAV